jgi:hypothetical protein
MKLQLILKYKHSRFLFSKPQVFNPLRVCGLPGYDTPVSTAGSPAIK